AAYLVYDHLLKHKWWADGRRAWRKLVRRCIDGVIKSQEPLAVLDVDLSPDEHGRLTVDQFAYSCRISRSKAYELIRAGTLPLASREGGRRMISEHTARRFSSVLRRSDIVAALMKRGRSQAYGDGSTAALSGERA